MSDITRIEKSIGAILLRDGKVWGYEGGRTDNGWVFKDYEAWETGEGVCYISEYGLNDLEEELCNLEATYENNPELTDEDYFDDRVSIVSGHGYTRQDFFDLCDGDAVLACDIFQSADWAYPETYLEEMFY